MKTYPPEILAALDAGVLIIRDFLWVAPRDRDTGARLGWGAWSGAGTVQASVADPVLGTVTRDFEGAGELVSVSEFGMVAGLQVQAITIGLAGVASAAEQLVRGYDARLAPMQLYRGILDPDTLGLVAPAEAMFTGFVDGVDITTPEAGGDGVITLSCANHVQELTRRGTSTRSDADQKLRDPDDDFYLTATDVSTWEVKWRPKA